ncbi:MAG: preprotein translocase subunit SecA, partial [Oscillospiraceae bacterium]
YGTEKAKLEAVCDQVEECHKKGQPVLVGTVSIEKSELISSMLRRRGIKHEVLNAKHHEKEAQIVAQAGHFGSVTIATNMAGRGTDIMLGGNPEFMAKQEMKKRGIADVFIEESTGHSETQDEEIIAARKMFEELNEQFKESIKEEAEKVKNAGGLYIIGTERHESRRIDNQLRGRSGRQGDPGETRFFLSLEDDLMRLFGGERIQNMMTALKVEDDTPLEAKMLSGTIESAQSKVEGRNFAIRKSVLQFDDVMTKQREKIYSQRRAVLDGEDLHDTVLKMFEGVITDKVNSFIPNDTPAENWNIEGLRDSLLGYVTTPEDLQYTIGELDRIQKEDITRALTNK